MRINFSQLKKLLVITRSGDKIGRVFELEVDVDSGRIVNYYIRINWRLLGIAKYLSITKLVINQDQVVEINDKYMVVQDNVVINFKKELVEKKISAKDLPSQILPSKD